MDGLNSLLTRDSDIPASVLRINGCVLIILLFLDALACRSYFTVLHAAREYSFLSHSSLLHRRRLRVLQTTLDILWPVAYVFVGVEDQINRAGHVMLALTFAHIVHRTVVLVSVIRYMIVLLVTHNFVRYKKNIK